ncbi:hypothetical protein Q31b_10690 [Novipirellula aureliae]|uniref:Uncharacterized protein n=1 Tax=Novipirellula aureliae TaxID=2527966 RepID=A0A5C6E896_9BACT|nr:hypothetical protein [Novipirellula aureliae]TWU45893.1 hypothetical protein Q31b_10690 [Novipirellula aureliae]
MAESRNHASQKTTIDRIPNGLIVLVFVAFLLKGPVGALDAFWQYTKSLLTSFAGGEDLLIEVLCQTIPLTLSIAIIAYLFRGGWLHFRSSTAVSICSIVIVVATWFGGQLRRSIENDDVAMPPRMSNRSLTAVSLRELSVKRDDFREYSNGESISLGEALKVITDNRSMNQKNEPSRQGAVPRVSLFPESGGILGTTARALNQVLGYFVSYGPRLFLAAVVLGIYIGCRLHSLWEECGFHAPWKPESIEQIKAG